MTLSSSAASLLLSTSATKPLILSKVLDIGRGGAITAAASLASSAFLNSVKQNEINIEHIEQLRGGVNNGNESKLTPQGSSVLYMAIAMSLHYLSYSIARPSTIALFTSAKTGFAGNTAAFPLAMAFISPTSLILLLMYGKILGKAGPRGALRQTTFIIASALWAASMLVYLLSRGSADLTIAVFGLFNVPVLKALVGALFIFRESYVQLLTSQYWSFMASTLTPDQSAKWFSPISGLTSITSAVAGLGVKQLVDKVGLPGALCAAGCILITSLLFSERAYSIADLHGFTPTDDHANNGKKKGKKNTSEKQETLIQKASALFSRVPVLKALFMEILAGQGLATLLNVCFVTKLSESLPDDTERAGWMGKFFAAINMVAMCLQFGVIPRIMPFFEPRYLWRFMPIVMVSAISYLCLDDNPSLVLISGAFMLFKVLEFSFRRMLDEMVYVPLDFDSRFLGKEIISVFGYRFGKSGMSLALSGLTTLFGNFDMNQLTYLTGGASLIWLKAAWHVSNNVLTKAEACELYRTKNTRKKQRR
mmetsp:Transcript_2460/g.3277  ORF Transcript_2460/g.3277 Transcript_2460/m.3277 type:complete len:536 (+) Transcript_2460:118-1725(+)